MEWETYEQLTAAIYKTLGKEIGVSVECYGSQCKVTGKSGSQYQIDVLVKQTNGLQVIRTAIECKYWSKKVDKRVVATLDSCIRDTEVDKGVIVSRLGFTEPAIQLAQQTNIGLVELREPIDSDWEGRIREIQIKFNLITTEIYDLEILQDQNRYGGVRQENFTVNPENVRIEEPARGVRTLQDIIQKELAKDAGEGRVIERCFLPDTLLRIEGDQRSADINGIRFKVRYHHLSDQISINAENYVYMIMRELFEKREFTLDRKGDLTEVDLTHSSGEP